MKQAYEYDGLDTCAADGMCQEKCPVKVSGLFVLEVSTVCLRCGKILLTVLLCAFQQLACCSSFSPLCLCCDFG